tara:strand:+ start:978 stop:1493 length:516 start_codon:yes stop_codon:yes gene_type:complete
MRPTQLNSSEHNSYYRQYIDLVEDIPLLSALELSKSRTQSFFQNIPKQKLEYRYAENKWTPKDILQHIIDTERVFGYRALYFSRDQSADLRGFDENQFAANTHANTRTIDDLLNEYLVVRNATVSLFKSFDDNQLKSIGMANNSKMSVRAAGFIICGHEMHHCNIINERYL